jgi:hypothetical protein
MPGYVLKDRWWERAAARIGKLTVVELCPACGALHLFDSTRNNLWSIFDSGRVGGQVRCHEVPA